MGKDKKAKREKKELEKGMVALAEQIGWFLGKVQAKADTLLDNEVVRNQVGQIRDGAIELFDRVSKASSAARQAAKPAEAEKPTAAAKPVAAPKPRAAKKRTAKKPARSLKMKVSKL